jgi:hypothetical protein
MQTALSIVATIISSIALIAVAAGLILQSRQLRTSHVQVIREMHLELIKLALENPDIAVQMSPSQNVDDMRREIFINYQMTLMRTAYSLKTTPRPAVESQARVFFTSEFARTWWTAGGARDNYRAESVNRAEAEFFEIVDKAFREVTQEIQQPTRPAE